MKRSGFIAVLLLAGACQKPPPPPPPAPAPPKPRMAEVEMVVAVQSDLDGGKSLLFVSPEPCDSPHAGEKKYGATAAQLTGTTFIEVFVPQGSSNYVCAAAFDDSGNLTGLGSAEGNPLRMSGEGEVRFSPKVHVTALASKHPAPAGFLDPPK
jgi:hypothetical protein